MINVKKKRYYLLNVPEIKKTINKLLLSPHEIHNFCDIDETKIDEIFPE